MVGYAPLGKKRSCDLPDRPDPEMAVCRFHVHLYPLSGGLHSAGLLQDQRRIDIGRKFPAGELAVQQLCLCFPEVGLRQVFPEQRGAGTADGGIYTDHLFHGGLCDQPPRFCGQKADLYGISAQYFHLGWFGGAVSSVYSHEPAGTDQEYGGSGTDAYRWPSG